MKGVEEGCAWFTTEDGLRRCKESLLSKERLFPFEILDFTVLSSFLRFSTPLQSLSA